MEDLRREALLPDGVLDAVPGSRVLARPAVVASFIPMCMEDLRRRVLLPDGVLDAAPGREVLGCWVLGGFSFSVSLMSADSLKVNS